MGLRTLGTPGNLLESILETPDLARVVQSLEPTVLHRLVRKCGLEDCGQIVALATTEQLMRVFDDDLWRAERAGGEEQFDADRFGVWLEVLAEAGADVAARKIVEMDFDFVTAALSRHVLVVDPEMIALERAAAELYEDVDPVEEARLAQVENALENGISYEVSGYRVVARRGEAWDALLAVLTSLAAGHHAYFGRLMARCSFLSTEYIVDNGGLYEVLTTDEQVLSDAASDRDERREQEGYVAPPLAVAFLNLAREPIGSGEAPPARDHVTVGYFRRLQQRTKEHATEGRRKAAEPAAAAPGSESTELRIRRLLATLQDADVLPAFDRPLLTAGNVGERDRLSLIRAHLVEAQEHDAVDHARRTEELGYLANVLMAGCSFQSRRFRTVEAADAVLAVCNLGLESWPRHWPVASDLVTVFRIGWSVLHEQVSLHVARRVVEVLSDSRVGDAAVRRDLATLGRRLESHVKLRTPWRGRDDLDLVAVLDPPSAAVLQDLVDECPVVPRGAGEAGSRLLRVTHEFEFISEKSQVLWARGFVESLPERLLG